MPADQIIEILKQDPELTRNIKNAVAQRQSVDPATITDDAIYNRIQQDAELRVQITAELKKRGYNTDETSADEEPDADRSTDGNVPRTRKKQNSAQRPKRTGTRRVETRNKAEEERDEPQMVHRPSPYPSLPSMKDLYSQFPSAEPKVKRFGSDVFRKGTGNSEDVPMDLPVGPDYVLGPGDGVALNMWGSQSQRVNRTIDRQGQIAVPEAGTLTVAGLTIAQAQAAIQKALNTQFQNEHVEISLGRLHTVRVYVVGDVQRPGAYDISSLSTPLNALYAAGGPTSRGSLRVLRQYRGKDLVKEIDLYDFLLHGVRSDIDRLMPGDTILVPPIGPQVTVTGVVRRPAIYELKGDQQLKEVLDMAGGTLVSASLKQINVERIEAHEQRTMLSVQLPDGKDGIDDQLTAFKVKDGDKVSVLPILPYSEHTVYLSGHVFRPGKYPYRDGMTVNELLRSYQDLLPEPADHAEIIRLRAPDFRPETIGFNLSDVLIGDDPITLQPFDVIRVFSRYEIDPPQVSIEGEVLRPGKYPLAQGMTVSGLINMAGGFKRSAYQSEADVTSYVVENGRTVRTKYHVIELGKQLEGNKNAEMALKPGDVVSIRQLTGWQDIGASVTVQGEVGFAGTYGIQQGERLSSVLRRAGGLRPEAYPAGAVLERVQVRQMGEKAREEMIRHVEASTPGSAGLGGGQEQLSLLQSMQQQQQQVLASLRSRPASGRQVIRISADIGSWANTALDIEVRTGDTLTIPKRPNFVLVSGQVYNATAITFVPGKDAAWYLNQAGGVTQSGNKKAAFVVRADGSVVGHNSRWSGGALSVRMQPGDAVVIPEKIVGGSQRWRNVMSAAQIMSSVAITGAAAGIF